MMDNPRAIHGNQHMMIILAAFLGKHDAKDIATNSAN
jgi:hypothetical protein